MIVDVNTFLGPYPFRSVRYTTAAEMLAHMDANGIDAALVSSLPAVFYRDAQRGNEELLRAIGPFTGRLFAVGMVNPAYAGWQRDLRWLVEQGATRAITLAPEHHGYRLTDERGRAAIQAIGETGLPLVLTQRLEDRRQRHHWDVAEDLKVDELLEVARANPALKFVLVNWLGLPADKLLAAGLRGRCLIDFARQAVVGTKEVPKLMEALGTGAIAFGSHMPFDYVASALVKLSNVEALFPEAFEQVAWKNADGFLGLGIAG